jgi:hypothetical protein
MYLRYTEIRALFKRIARLGRQRPSAPWLQDVNPFSAFLNVKGIIQAADTLDGGIPRRELLTRYLFLNAVLDQGPDMTGVRMLLARVTNQLYKEGIRFIHKPEQFFTSIERVVQHILNEHESVKKIRHSWASENLTNPSSYNLFVDRAKQVVNFAISRWGVPLTVILLLERERGWLIDHIESFKSAEFAAGRIKSDRRYGLGKAIGDKAFHLFLKWIIHTYHLTRRSDAYWSGLSYEVPFDSNTGRVLFRTGAVLSLLNLDSLYSGGRWAVLFREADGTSHIRVTNLRGRSVPDADGLLPWYQRAVRERMLPGARPTRIEFQRLPNAVLFQIAEEDGEEYSVGEFDDGLVAIGTGVCSNWQPPKCHDCHVREMCYGTREMRVWLEQYHT